MTTYISPILGELQEDVFEYFINRKQLVIEKQQMTEFLKDIRESTHFGVLRAGVLLEETKGKRIEIRGSELESYLNSIGYPRATDLTKVFALNQTLIEDLVSQGWDIRDAIYGLDLAGRLDKLGLERRTIEAKYAREMLISIYPTIEVPEIEVPPPPEIIYRSQATFTYSKGKKKVELRIWYQSYNTIEESELIDKWNEANKNAVNLPSSDIGNLLDSLEPAPGFELNHEITIYEIEGSINIWYGVLLFTDKASEKQYNYKVL